MENMEKRLTVPKWVLIVWPKIPQMPQNLYAQFVYPIPKVWDFDEKRLHWVSVVHDYAYGAHVSIQCPIYVPGFPKERKPHLKEKNLRNFDIENGKYVQEYIL